MSSDGGIFLQTLKFSPFLPSFPHVVNFLNCKFESTVQILQSQYFFTHNTDILIKLCRNWKAIKEAHGAKFYRFNSLDLPKKTQGAFGEKTQGAFGEKTQNSRKIQKKLKNRQLQLS